MAQKIEFKVQIFYSDRYPTTFRRVTNLVSAFNWCASVNSQNITAMDIYHKRTKAFLVRVHSISEIYMFWNSLLSKYE